MTPEFVVAQARLGKISVYIAVNTLGEVNFPTLWRYEVEMENHLGFRIGLDDSCKEDFAFFEQARKVMLIANCFDTERKDMKSRFHCE